MIRLGIVPKDKVFGAPPLKKRKVKKLKSQPSNLGEIRRSSRKSTEYVVHSVMKYIHSLNT